MQPVHAYETILPRLSQTLLLSELLPAPSPWGHSASTGWTTYKSLPTPLIFNFILAYWS